MNKLQQCQFKELQLFAKELKVLGSDEFILCADDEFIVAQKKSRGFRVIFEGGFDLVVGFLLGANYGKRRL